MPQSRLCAIPPDCSSISNEKSRHPLWCSWDERVQLEIEIVRAFEGHIKRSSGGTFSRWEPRHCGVVAWRRHGCCCDNQAASTSQLLHSMNTYPLLHRILPLLLFLISICRSYSTKTFKQKFGLSATMAFCITFGTHGKSGVAEPLSA